MRLVPTPFLLTPLLLVVGTGSGVGKTASQNLESELARARTEINRLEMTVERLEGENREMQSELERPFCTAAIDSVNGIRQFAVAPGANSTLEIGVVSVVSNARGCMPTRFTAIASYLDGQENLLCSGIVTGVATQSESAAVVTFTVRPWNLREFIRWRNEPPRTNSGFQILFCETPDGLTEAAPADLGGAASLRLRILAQPGNGGLASEDFVIIPGRE